MLTKSNWVLRKSSIMLQRAVVGGVLVGALVVLSGCGSPVGTVEGQLVFAGQPVSRAEVVFAAVENESHQFFGTSLDDGKLYLSYRTGKGIPPGRYNVQVTYFKGPDGTPLPAGEQGMVMRTHGQASREVFVLEVYINAGRNTLNVDLQNAQTVPPDPPA
jgi:hypothetical protein